MDDLDKKFIVATVRKGFDALTQFINLDDMIDDIPDKVLNNEQKKWAKENIEWDLKINKA